MWVVWGWGVGSVVGGWGGEACGHDGTQWQVTSEMTYHFTYNKKVVMKSDFLLGYRLFTCHLLVTFFTCHLSLGVREENFMRWTPSFYHR